MLNIKGINTVTILEILKQQNFVNLYRGGGEGIHSFIDPADKLQYVYTKFEPAACHYMFPVFD